MLSKSCIIPLWFPSYLTLWLPGRHLQATRTLDRQKHTTTFNNLDTIRRITVYSISIKTFGIRDLYWENNLRIVEKIALCLPGVTTLYTHSLFFFYSPCIHRVHTETFTCFHLRICLQIKSPSTWWPQGCAKGKTSNVSPAIHLSFPSLCK